MASTSAASVSGLVRYSSMPASRLARTSSVKALAVMARMGTLWASGRSSARMARAASRPSMTGIMMSSSTTSKCPGLLTANAPTASCPLTTLSTWAPFCSSMNSAISRLRSLSSARSACAPAMPAGSAGSPASPASSRAPWSTSSGSSTVTVVPFCGSLWMSMLPPMRSTSIFVMESPSPVPAYEDRAPSFSWANGSRACERNSSLMPAPSSSQVKR